jgi:2,3-bisphosphoglycerate-dependent phosphoglycerate mutase
MRLLLIRHAESFGNQAKQIQGQTQETLTPTGCQQARQLGYFLRQSSWQPSHIYTSPLPRALQTATILQEIVLGEGAIGLQTHSALSEIHNGILQGLTWAEALQQYPDLCQQLESTPLWQPIPAAETPSHVQARAQEFIAELFTQHQNPDQVWLVSHGGLIPYLLAALLETPCLWSIQIPLTAIFELEIDLEYWPQRHQYALETVFWTIHRFNQTPHLP